MQAVISDHYYREGGWVNQEAGVSWTQGNKSFKRPVAGSVPSVQQSVLAKGRGFPENTRLPQLYECRRSVLRKIYYRMG